MEKTWEKIYRVIEEHQPIKGVDMIEISGLRKGQISGGLATLREKGLVKQSSDKSYSIREQDLSEFIKADIEDLIRKYKIKEGNKGEDYEVLMRGLEDLLSNYKVEDGSEGEKYDSLIQGLEDLIR